MKNLTATAIALLALAGAPAAMASGAPTPSGDAAASRPDYPTGKMTAPKQIVKLLRRTAEITAAYESPISHGGEDLTDGERGELLRRNGRIKNLLLGRRQRIWGGIRDARQNREKFAGNYFAKYMRWAKAQLRWVEGRTGHGGKLFEVRNELARLGGEAGGATA